MPAFLGVVGPSDSTTRPPAESFTGPGPFTSGAAKRLPGTPEPHGVEFRRCNFETTRASERGVFLMHDVRIVWLPTPEGSTSAIGGQRGRTGPHRVTVKT